MNIEFISFESSYVKTDKGGYNKGVVNYTDERGNSKSKPLMSFSNPKVYDTFKNAKAGQTYLITTKQEGQYVNWAAADLVETGAKAPAAAESGGKAQVYTPQYETRDERNARQRLIVRQSSLANAVEILTTGAKNPPDLDQVKLLAEDLVAFVYEAPELGALETMADDIPY